MTEPRGLWNVERGIIARWREAGLDDLFRAEWDDPTNARYEPLNDGEARPEPPGPYCVYNLGVPRRTASMSGKTADTTIDVSAVALEFRIHAVTSGRESGKSRAARLAAKVAEAFDPVNPIEICGDSWIQTARTSDNALRLGDDEWVWVLMLEITFEATYAVRPS